MNKYTSLIQTVLAMLPGRERADAAETARVDAATSVFLTQELQQIEAEIYRKEYADLKWRQIMPVKNSGLNPGAESFAYRVFTGFGLAKFFANMAKDLPTSTIKAEKFVSKVESLGSSYSLSVDELLAASMAGLSIEREKSDIAGEEIERLMDSTAALGRPDLGFQGFLNLPGVTIDTTAANGTGSSTYWADKVGMAGGVGPSRILKDLHDFLAAGDVASKGKIKYDRVVMPQTLYNVMATTPMSDTGFNDATILSTFLKTSPYIKSESQIATWYHADHASSTGHGRIVAFKYDRRYLEAYVPKEVEVLPAVNEGFEWKVPMWAKFGGVVLRMPPSVRYLDGADNA